MNKIENILFKIKENLAKIGNQTLDDVSEGEIKHLRWRFLVINEQFDKVVELYHQERTAELLTEITRVRTGLKLFEGQLHYARALYKEDVL